MAGVAPTRGLRPRATRAAEQRRQQWMCALCTASAAPALASAAPWMLPVSLLHPSVSASPLGPQKRPKARPQQHGSPLRDPRARGRGQEVRGKHCLTMGQRQAAPEPRKRRLTPRSISPRRPSAVASARPARGSAVVVKAQVRSLPASGLPMGRPGPRWAGARCVAGAAAGAHARAAPSTAVAKGGAAAPPPLRWPLQLQRVQRMLCWGRSPSRPSPHPPLQSEASPAVSRRAVARAAAVLLSALSAAQPAQAFLGLGDGGKAVTEDYERETVRRARGSRGSSARGRWPQRSFLHRVSMPLQPLPPRPRACDAQPTPHTAKPLAPPSAGRGAAAGARRRGAGEGRAQPR